MSSIKIRIPDMRCASCAARIENVLKQENGVNTIVINTVTKIAFINFFEEKISPSVLKQVIQKTGYTPEDVELQTSSYQEDHSRLQKNLIGAALASIPTVILSMGHDVGISFPAWISTISPYLQFGLTSIVLIIGKEFFIKGIKAVIIGKTATMDTLVALGVGTSYLYSIAALIRGHHMVYFETAAVLITFILLGRFLEAVAKGKTSQAIAALINLQPKTAYLIQDDEEIEIPITKVKPGDILRVKPGQQVPVDGIIIEGHSAINQSMLTGESIPIEKKIHDQIIAGTLNLTGSILFKVEKVGEETFLASIIKLVENAQNTKAPIQQFADKISALFVPFVILLALTSSLVWLSLGQPLSFVLNIAVSVLIIACPCALGLATPTAIMVGSGLCAKQGILIKNAKALQEFHTINTVIFDKTGTLTEGHPVVTQVLSESHTEEEILSIAASLEIHSDHPLAKSIIQEAKAKKITLQNSEENTVTVGIGVSGKIGKNYYSIGKPSSQIHTYSTQKLALENEGKTVLILEENQKEIGLIALADTLKPSTKKLISELHKKNIQVWLLTGDNLKTAEHIAKECGIHHFIANTTPQDKATTIQTLQKEGNIVAMVGDGINDAPALAHANIGIAIGQGTDIAIESADIILINKNLEAILQAYTISEKTVKKIKQNLFWAFFYNAIGLQVAAGMLYPVTGILLNPMIGGFAMAMSSVSVLTNTLFLRTTTLPKI